MKYEKITIESLKQYQMLSGEAQEEFVFEIEDMVKAYNHNIKVLESEIKKFGEETTLVKATIVTIESLAKTIEINAEKLHNRLK